MKTGDLCFFYHSSCKVPGIAGIVEVTRAAIPDDDALDAAHPLFDGKHTREAPKWYCCDIKMVRPMKSYISLPILRSNADKIKDMVLLRQPRLSVQPVTSAEWSAIIGIEEELASGVHVALPAAKPLIPAAVEERSQSKRSVALGSTPEADMPAKGKRASCTGAPAGGSGARETGGLEPVSGSKRGRQPSATLPGTAASASPGVKSARRRKLDA